MSVWWIVPILVGSLLVDWLQLAMTERGPFAWAHRKWRTLRDASYREDDFSAGL